MMNKYPGTCYWCNTRVEKNGGHFERINRSWRVIHVLCMHKQRKYKELAKNNHISLEEARERFEVKRISEYSYDFSVENKKYI